MPSITEMHDYKLAEPFKVAPPSGMIACNRARTNADPKTSASQPVVNGHRNPPRTHLTIDEHRRSASQKQSTPSHILLIPRSSSGITLSLSGPFQARLLIVPNVVGRHARREDTYVTPATYSQYVDRLDAKVPSSTYQERSGYT